MFFIAPDLTEKSSVGGVFNSPDFSDLARSVSKRRKRLVLEVGDDASHRPKRTSRACDRCRLRKSKCTGGPMCEKCKQDDVVCVTSQDLKKPSSPPDPMYTQLVESQRDRLAQALTHLLDAQTSDQSAKIRKQLAEVGIPAAGPFTPTSVSDYRRGDDIGPSGDTVDDLWSTIVGQLDEPQVRMLGASGTLSSQVQGDIDILGDNAVSDNAIFNRSNTCSSQGFNFLRAFNEPHTSIHGLTDLQPQWLLHNNPAVWNRDTPPSFKDWADGL